MSFDKTNSFLTFLIVTTLLPVTINCTALKSQAANNFKAGETMARPVIARTNAVTNEPELPRFYLDTTYTPPTGAVKAVETSGELQDAINNANPGDVLSLKAGVTFSGNFTFPAKTGSGWIIIRSSAPDSSLPSPGTRITPSSASVLPKIVTPNANPAVTIQNGAHHYRFIGVEISPAASVTKLTALVLLGSSQQTADQIPHDLIFDRVYIHGYPAITLRRGIAMSSASTAIIDSYISDVHELGADSQAIASWNGPGPFKIVNNYLEAAGENIMFGGADPSIQDLVPSDIEFRRNYCFKPLSWKTGETVYAGRRWTIKNLFELKNVQRILIEGNTFENNWAESQSGFAVQITVRNQDGTAPWSIVQDVTFTNNIIRHSGCGINIGGSDNDFPSLRTQRVKISNSLFEDINGPRWGNADGRWLQIISGPEYVKVDHNTAFQTGPISVADSLPPSQGFVFQNNLAPNNQYGFFGSDRGTGNSALDFYFPDAVFKKNVIVAGPQESYPADNFFPANFDLVKFTDKDAGNYRLLNTSPYRRAGTDGRDVGVDFDLLNAALSGVSTLTSVSAASYLSDSLAPESIASAFGSGLTTVTQGVTATPLPTSLQGTSVNVRDSAGVDRLSPLFFISPTQLNYQIPGGTAIGLADISVINGGKQIALGSTQIARVSPGLFTADASGAGYPSSVVLRVKSNNVQQYEEAVRFDQSLNRYVAVPIDLGPASDQVFIILFGTGFRFRTSLSSVTANIGGVNSQVTYAGFQSGFVGLDQVNLRLSRDLIGRGEVNLALTADGTPANIVKIFVN